MCPCQNLQFRPCGAKDISRCALARLARQIADSKEPPSHLKLMNMVSRAAGPFGNFQHLPVQPSLLLSGWRTCRCSRTIDRSSGRAHAQPVRRRGAGSGNGPSRRKIQESCASGHSWAALPARIPDEPSARSTGAPALHAHLFADLPANPAPHPSSASRHGQAQSRWLLGLSCRRELRPPPAESQGP